MVKTKASFIQLMLLVRTEKLSDDRQQWAYELKSDGFRCVAFKSGGKSTSGRSDKDLSRAYLSILAGPLRPADETVMDG